MRYSFAVASAVFALSAISPSAMAERLFVSNDEWMFTDSSISTANDTQFAKNTISWLTGGTPGNVLILSNNFGLTGSGYNSILTGLGYTVTTTTTVPTSLSGYSAVLVAGMPVSNTLLTQYVNGGGNVLLEAGTGYGGSSGEAAQWNTFLNTYGLSLYGPSYNGVGGSIGVSAFSTQSPYGPALFAGVNSVYINNGNNVLLAPGSTSATQVFSDANGNGLYGAWAAPVPEPETYAMVLVGLGLMGFMVSRKKSA